VTAPQPPTRENDSAPAGSSDPGQLDPSIAALLKRDPAGLVAAVVQEQSTGEVLMVGWMDDAALHRTLTTGRSTFYSRSRSEYWVKGETSGHRQWVKEVRLDCDGDTVLVQVHQEGSACHTGTRTCFDERVLTAVVAPEAQPDLTEQPETKEQPETSGSVTR
jgi:phosphoribosyl-AMP cyclohydrolase